MFETIHRSVEIPASGLKLLPDEIVAGGKPTFLCRAFRDWPIVLQLGGDPMEPILSAHRYSDQQIDPSKVAKGKQGPRDLVG